MSCIIKRFHDASNTKQIIYNCVNRKCKNIFCICPLYNIGRRDSKTRTYTIACTKRTIKSLFSSSGADEEPISRDNPVSCSKKYNIEVSLRRDTSGYPKPLFFLRVLKKIANVRTCVYARVYVYVYVIRFVLRSRSPHVGTII